MITYVTTNAKYYYYDSSKWIELQDSTEMGILTITYTQAELEVWKSRKATGPYKAVNEISLEPIKSWTPEELLELYRRIGFAPYNWKTTEQVVYSKVVCRDCKWEGKATELKLFPGDTEHSCPACLSSRLITTPL